MPRFTTELRGKRRIVDVPPLITRVKRAEFGRIAQALDLYLTTPQASVPALLERRSAGSGAPDWTMRLGRMSSGVRRVRLEKDMPEAGRL